MCKALEELKKEGIKEGIQTGIMATIRTCKKFQISKAATIENIMHEFSLPEDAAIEYVEKYW